MDSKIAITRAGFIDFMGRALETQGMPPISGRILGLLIFDGTARSFSDLATELGVSRGSISANSRSLVARGMLEKVNHPGDRQDYFRVSEQSNAAILTGIGARLRRASQDVSGFAGALAGTGAEGPRRRLQNTADMYTAMADGLDHAADRLAERG